jgi:hypothetical protein
MQVVPKWDEKRSQERSLKNGTSREGLKRDALNKLEWRKSVRSCVGLRQRSDAVSCW